MPLVALALGAALVSTRQSFPKAPEKHNDRQDAAAVKAVQRAASHEIALSDNLAVDECYAFAAVLR